MIMVSQRRKSLAGFCRIIDLSLRTSDGPSRFEIMPRSSVTRHGELERAVMEHLWTHREAGGGSLTVREVHETVGTQRELAYTTVMTVLDRLAKKRLVTQERDGRAYRYFPVSTREELTAWIANAGLKVLAHTEVRPSHPKASDPEDPLHAARSKELTGLWRLTAC